MDTGKKPIMKRKKNRVISGEHEGDQLSAQSHRLYRQRPSLNDLAEVVTELVVELASLGTVDLVHSEHGRSAGKTRLSCV
jgi:hypothetical protein